MSPVFFHTTWTAMFMCTVYQGKVWHQDPLGRWQAAGGSVTLCWGTPGLAIHVDVSLTRASCLNIVADLEHSFMTGLFPGGSGLFQQDKVHCTHRPGMIWGTWWRVQGDAGLQIPQIFIKLSIWDVLEVRATVASPRKPTGLEGSADNVLVPDMETSRVHASVGRCFGLGRTNIKLGLFTPKFKILYLNGSVLTNKLVTL